MAAIYRVRDETGARWALKRLTLNKDDVRERFRQEARIQLQLSHPHIVRGRELVDIDGDPALVMELVDGVPLDLWQLANPDAPLSHKDRIARQMVDAIALAHREGMVHRDLKPGNVLVEDRSGPWAKITDFGLAKWHDGDAATRSGIALGTPRYMAPEQVRDAKRVDQRADVWSLGVILYELYTGQPAFHRGNLIEVFQAVVEGRYIDPATFGVPERVCRAVRGALVVDPEGRLPDCNALLVALGPQPSLPPHLAAVAVLPSAEAPRPVHPDGTAITLMPDAFFDPDALTGPPASSLAPARPSDDATILSPAKVERLAELPTAVVSHPAPRPAPRPARRRRQKPLPVRLWIIAWLAALMLIIGAVAGSLAVIGGAVAVRSLWSAPVTAPAR